MAIGNMVGASVRRHEDPKLVTGAGTYVDDIKLPGMLYVGIVRSPHAHARITNIDTSQAQGQKGVVRVVSGGEIRERQKAPLPITWVIPPDIKTPEHWAVATDKSHYAGEPVAAVVVEDRYQIEDALDMISVDYEPLPVVMGIEEALKEGSPLVHDELGTNQAYHFAVTTGDIEAAFKDAEVVVKQRLVNQRLASVSIETRGIVAQYNKASGELTVWSSTQIPHLLRHHLAEMLGMPEHNIRVIAPDVGGGFGSKLNVLPEDFIVPLMAIITGRPVKWIESRTENMQNTVHGRDMVDYVEIAANRDGTILGLKAGVYANLGAYCRFFAAGLPVLAGLMLPGNYKLGAFQVDIYTAYTNTLFVDAYRGAGRPEATYAVERIVDMLADELGMDPAELRRKNFVQEADWPYTSPTGLAYDSGNYVPTLDKALQMAGYQEARGRIRQHNSGNPRVRKGIGMAAYVEIAGWGPGQATKGIGVRNQLFGSATVRVDRSGTVEVLAGASGHGQGHTTSWAQIAADRLGISHEQVKVYEGDTAMVQTGTGTFASRSVSVDGAGVYMAAQKIRDKMLKIAAHQLEVDPADLEMREGMITVRGMPLEQEVIAGGRLQTAEAAAEHHTHVRPIPFSEIALAANTGHDLPEGLEPGLNETAFFDPVNFTYPFGVHIAEVDVDTETGEVKITRYVAVDDCGNVINPMIVDGQVHGGVTQGVAQALWEEVVYDENGQLLTGTLMDYAVPFSSDLPMFETGMTVTPSPVNPLGVKGVGEAGTIAATPVIVNAVVDALSDLGVRHIDMPLRPEKVWRAIAGRRQVVIPKEFDYVAPGSLDEALSALRDGGEDAKVLAGGHSLIPLMKLRLAAPSLLVDLRKIGELKGISGGGNGQITIGAMTTHHELHHSEDLKASCPVLSECAHSIGDIQVRARGTIGGSLAHADPAADLTAAALALGATMLVAGSGGSKREIPAGDFFVDLLTSALGPGEILTGIRVPKLQGRTGSAYVKVRNKASHYALVGAAAVLTLGDDGTCSQCAIAITGAASKPFRLTNAEAALRGTRLQDGDVSGALGTVDDLDVDWMSDLFGSEEYRRHLTAVVAGQAIEAARGRIR